MDFIELVELQEETGFDICNIRYAGSQVWPFPDQLMVGYYADYLSGEISIQEEEISEAAWLSAVNLPASPRPGSISWRFYTTAGDSRISRRNCS